jgi:rhamnosyltransferase
MIIGVIVTYNPIISELKENVNSIFTQVDKLVIFDNSSDNQIQLSPFSDIPKISLFLSKTNVGLGEAYNTIIRLYKNDFDYLVTFDQDTKIPDFLIKNLLTFFEIQNVGIVGPSFEKAKNINDSFQDVDFLIQSSSIFKMNLFSEIGLFNAEYFIDSIDFEFCLRAKLCGFRVLRSNLNFITHSLGSKKKFLCISFISHNAIRNFYISRNHVHLTIKYFKIFPYFIIKKNIYFLLHVMKLFFLERDFIKIKYFFKGFLAGLKSY